MSKESAIAFWERLEGDEVLLERIRGCTVSEVEKLVKGELGYDFTKEEMQQVIFEKNPELTDEELEAVVGGGLGGDIALCVGAIGGSILVGSLIGAGIGVCLVAAVAGAA